jgi:acetolactate decarboxylase
MANNFFKIIFILSTSASFGQTITVNDTDFSKGKLGNIQKVKLNDVVKFHGHLCDGLIESFIALDLGLKQLYPNGILDRTNNRIVSKSSPCLSDMAIYVTGGRTQYNTFYVDNTIDGFYVVQRIDNLKAILIKRKPNVKPAIIDELGNKAINGELNECELEILKKLEDEYSKFLKKSKPKDLFEIVELSNFTWQPKIETYTKTDIINKNKSTCK